MTYQVASQFAQTWGLVFLVAAFVLAVAYALWPSNRKSFDRAARRPLEEVAAPIRNDELRK